MKLMLAVDISDDSSSVVVREASRWAERMQGKLDVVHAEGSRYQYQFIDDPNVRKLMAVEAEKMRAIDRSKLYALAEGIPEAHRGEVHLVEGRAVDALIEHGEGYSALLIATHGRTGLSHLWLGSVAEQVVRKSTVPVMVLRIPHD